MALSAHRGAGKRRASLIGVAGFVWFLAVLPIALALAGVARFGVDVPVGDQWTIAPMFERLELSTVGATGLFSQANESRPAFPRLVFVTLASIDYWNVKREMFATQALLVLTSVGLLLLARRASPASPLTIGVLMLAVNMTLFSWTQYDNFLWGIQFIVYLPFACLVWSCVLALGPAPFRVVAVSVAMLNIIATFSYANGMVSWPITAALLLALRGREARRSWVVSLLWVIVAGSTYAFYFLDFAWPTGNASWSMGGVTPSRVVGGFMVLLGSGLSVALRFADRQHVYAGVIGLVIVACLVVLLVYAWRNRSRASLFRSTVVGFALVAYGVCSAVVTVAGRLGFGLEYLLASRYVAFTGTVLVGLTFLTSIVVQDAVWQRRPLTAALASHAAVALGTAFALLWCFANLQSRAHMHELYRTRLQAKALLPFVEVANPTHVRAVLSHQGEGAVIRVLPALVTLGVLPEDRLLPSWSDGSETDDLLQVGSVESMVQESDVAYDLSGWTYLPHARRSGDAIVVTTRVDGERRPVVAVTPDVVRPDVVDRTRSPGAIISGWRATVHLYKSDEDFEIWTIDAEAGRAHRLKVDP